MRIRLAVPVLFILIAAALPAAAQEAAEAPAAYTDDLFTAYIGLENEVLAMIGEGTIERYVLGRIESMKDEASAANRRDIISRLDMLAFVAESGLREQETTADSESFKASVAAEERKLRGEKDARKAAETAASVSIGTAILAGSIFTASAIISSDFYDKYTLTEYADQAAFYLFWWQLLDKVALVSGITSLVTSVTAGILAAAY